MRRYDRGIEDGRAGTPNEKLMATSPDYRTGFSYGKAWGPKS